jgi:hypothetical protein
VVVVVDVDGQFLPSAQRPMLGRVAAAMLLSGVPKKVRFPYSFLASALSALALTACGGGDPTIAVTASKTTLASGDTVTLTVTTTNFELRAPPAQALRVADGDHEHSGTTGDALTADGGHYHVYLDSTDVNPLKMAWIPTVDITVTTSVAGDHELIVRLNADDHRYLVPEVKAHVDITVE